MTVTLTRQAYEQLVEEDVGWLIAHTPDSLERQHVIEVLRWSAHALYRKPTSGDLSAFVMLATEAKAVAARATPGPWGSGRRYEQADPGAYVYQNDGVGMAIIACEDQAPTEADADFIVAAANAAPVLADSVLGLVDEVERLRAAVRALGGTP